MGKSRRNYRIISLLSVWLMLFTLIFPGLTEAQAGAYDGLVDSKSSNLSKLSDGLLEKFEMTDEVTFLIKFQDKADVKKAVLDANKKNKSLSAYSQELQQRSAVISELKSTASGSQITVQNYLDNEVRKGNAKDVESYYIVNAIAVTATKEVAEKLALFPEVEKILPNETRQLISGTEETAAVSNETDANIEWNVQHIGAPDLWKKGIDGTGIVVASIDTGVEWEHPSLKEKYRGYNVETNEVDHTYSFFDAVNGQEESFDDDGHGTHVTGTMVGAEPGGKNQIGVAPGAKWIAVKAFTPAGGEDTDLLAAAEWIMAPGGDVTKAPDIVNNSWAGGPGLDEWYLDVVLAWREAGIFPLFAAGNTTLSNPGGPGSVAAPGNYPEAFTVGATDSNDNLASFSLQGPSPYGKVKPDISAPGVAIRSAAPGGKYTLKNGTSMATPAVAGVIALLLQADYSKSIEDIEQLLISTADAEAGTDDNFPNSPNNGYGYGIVDAVTALSFIEDGYGKVTGQVTTSGEDAVAPRFEHDAPLVAYKNMDLYLKVHVSDNVSVTSVVLKYGEHVVEAKQLLGDHLSGDYLVVVPGEDIGGDAFSYQWIINDFGGNEVVSGSYVLPVNTGISTGYHEDFEATPIGWTILGERSSWEWGVPTSGPNSALTGENVYATNLNGKYNNSENSLLVMPAIDIPEGESYVQFNHWYDFENSYDYGHLLVSTDQKNWEQVASFTGRSGGWGTVEVDFSDYSGRVYVAFNMLSDPAFPESGWYINDVAISDTSLIQQNQKVNQIAFDSVNKITMSMDEVVNGVNLANNKLSSLPLVAQISVLETGRSTVTSPVDGTYTLFHNAGEFTVIAEAYGYHPKEQTVTIEDKGVAQVDLRLEEKPQFIVSGQVVNATTEEPIKGATILLVEDANVLPVHTGEDGDFSFPAYTGEYTLKVVANGYHPYEVPINLDEDMKFTIEMEPLYTLPLGEIAYDNGIADFFQVFLGSGYGFAVRMSLPHGVDEAVVTEGVFQFWDSDSTDQPETDFSVEVWSSGEDGLPDKKVAGPIPARAINSLSEQTVVDLRNENIKVNGDFYMVYVQTATGSKAPGIALNMSGPNAERAYTYANGTFDYAPYYGNVMMRARIAKEIDAPVIQQELDGSITNKANLTVQGTAANGTVVELLQNGKSVGESETIKEGKFTFDTTLAEGNNKFTAVLKSGDEEVARSKSVSVTLDTVAPELGISKPTDGAKVTTETIVVEGTVTDERLDSVEINNQVVSIENGEFSEQVKLKTGTNAIVVKAIDRAGNEQVESVTVTYYPEKVGIERLEGETRYETSIAVSRNGWDSAKTVILARGDDFADALSSVPLAYQLDAPILLTPTDRLLDSTLAEINRLGVEEVIIIGGEGAVKSKVSTSLSLSKNDFHVTRIAGANRFETAALIADELTPNGTDKVVVANGMNFPDALSVASYAATEGIPILLTESNKIPTATGKALGKLGVEEAIIVGGTKVVSDKLLQNLPNPTRLSGTDRYETNIAIAEAFEVENPHMYVATGKDYADALTGAVLAAKNNSGVLLVSNRVPDVLSDYIVKQNLSAITIFGGRIAVNQSTQNALSKLLK